MLLVVIFFWVRISDYFFFSLFLSFFPPWCWLGLLSCFIFLLFLLYLFFDLTHRIKQPIPKLRIRISWFFLTKENKSSLFTCQVFFIKNNMIGYKIHDSYFQSCLLDDLVSRMFIYFCIGIFVYVLVFWHFCRPRSTRTQWPFRFAFRQNTGGWTYLPMWFVRIFA